MLMGILALVSGRVCVCVCTIYLDFSDTTTHSRARGILTSFFGKDDKSAHYPKRY